MGLKQEEVLRASIRLRREEDEPDDFAARNFRQLNYGKELDSTHRDALRAQIIRSALNG